MVVCPLRRSQYLILTAGPSQAGCRRHDPERRIGRKRRHPDAHASPESRQVARCATTLCASLQDTRGHGSIRDLTRRSGLFPAPDHSAHPGRERLEEGTPSDAVDRERNYRDPKAPQDELHAHTTSRLPKFCASGRAGLRSVGSFEVSVTRRASHTCPRNLETTAITELIAEAEDSLSWCPSDQRTRRLRVAPGLPFWFHFGSNVGRRRTPQPDADHGCLV